jgi:DNA-directed RNA polymerase specialized sigma24 family protein
MANYKANRKDVNEELDFLLKAIDSLPPEAAKVIRLHYIGQQPVGEIAAILQQSIDVINNLHIEGICLLRKQVQQRAENN